MTKAEWIDLSQDERFVELRTMLRRLIDIVKEQSESCRNREIFKKPHLKRSIEQQIATYLQWDKEI